MQKLFYQIIGNINQNLSDMNILEKLTKSNATILIDIYKDHSTNPITGWEIAEWYNTHNIVPDIELKLFADSISNYIFDNIHTDCKKKKKIDNLFRKLAKNHGWSEDTHELIIEQQITKNKEEFR